MVDIIPEGKIGDAEIVHYAVSKHESIMSSFRRGDQYCPEGKYATLKVGGRLMMSDTRFEHNTNYEVKRRACGDVLIAGLGIGMVLHPILSNPNVRRVTVIEKSADVIALVAPHVQPKELAAKKLTVVHADIFDWKPIKGTRYDVIYFDIWPDVCTDNLEEIAKLHRRFKSYKNSDNPCAWMSSWCHERLKTHKRQESRMRW